MLSRPLVTAAFTCTSLLALVSGCTETSDRPPPPPLPNIDPNRPPVVRPRDAGRPTDTGTPTPGDDGATPPPPPGDGGTPGDPDTGIPSTCGNGMIDVGEECDDGNTERLDGCAACQVLPAAVAQYIRLIIDEGMDGIDARDRERWCDLDEDGDGDNALADVGMQIVLDTLFNPDTSMHMAWVALVFDGLDLSVLREGGTGADDSVSLAGVIVTDANDNAFDNFTGVGEFMTAPESFMDGSIRVGAMSIGPMSRFRIDAERLAFSYRTMDGAMAPLRIDIRKATIEGTLRVTDDGSRIRDVRSGSVCGAISIRSFLSIPSPVDGSSSTLAEDLVRGLNIGGFALPPARPDIDLDDDGLEQFEIVDGNIEACIDGDGTRIPGDGCIMDIRIVDGLSIFATFSGPGARILGATP